MLHNPKFEAARALLSSPLPSYPDHDGDEERMRAGIAALQSVQRRLAAEAIEGLIEFLDELDGDPDKEPTMADLGYPGDPRHGGSGVLDECEDEGEDEPDEGGIADADALLLHQFDEPSLAAPECHPDGPSQHMCRSSRGDQTRWARGSSGDGEDDDDGEPDDSGFGDMDGMLEDSQTGGEPSLGWTAAINQDGRNWHGTSKLPLVSRRWRGRRRQRHRGPGRPERRQRA